MQARGMVVSTVWALALVAASNLQRARRTVPPDSLTFNHTRFPDRRFFLLVIGRIFFHVLTKS